MNKQAIRFASVFALAVVAAPLFALGCGAEDPGGSQESVGEAQEALSCHSWSSIYTYGTCPGICTNYCSTRGGIAACYTSQVGSFYTATCCCNQ